jgi:hypothetical protein
VRLLLSTARYVPIYRGRLGKFRHWGTSRCYAGDVEAAPEYVNDFLATPDGLPGDAKLRLPADAAAAGTLGPAVSALATDGAAGWNDGILTKNSSFRVNVGGVGVGLKSHNLMASFF